MIYRVFLDTNIYDAANYSFHNAQFERLVSLAASGQLNIVINSVVEGEVRGHIRERVQKAVASLAKAAKESVFAGFRNASEFKDKLLVGTQEEWVEYSLSSFSTFLSSCALRRIPLNGIDIESVMDDYFQQKYPFEQRKPDEFKDAFVVKSLFLDMQEAWDQNSDLIQYCIISSDKGFTAAIKEAINGKEIEDYTLLFNSLIEFTDYLADMDKQMQFMLKYLQSDYGRDLLQDAVKEALETATYNIEEDNEIVDQELVDVEILSTTPHVISLNNTAGTPDCLEAIIEGEANITVDYTYNDNNKSYYDKEEHAYIYLYSETVSATHKVKFSIPMTFIANECLATEEELENGDDSVFEDKSMELDAWTEQTINLTEKNRTGFDVIESSDDGSYDTCPDCGCRIGIDNDGGNGFCINCAPNH